MGSKRMRRWDGTVRPVDDGRWKICSGRLPNFRRRCAPMISQRLGWLASHHQVETAGPSPSYCACVRVSMYFMPVWGPFSIRWSRFFRLDSVPVPSWISFSDTFFFFIVLRCAWTTIRHQNQILAKSSLVFSTRLSSSFVFNFFPCVTAFRRFSNNDASSELNPFQKSVPFFTSFPSGSSASAATRCCIGFKKNWLSVEFRWFLFVLFVRFRDEQKLVRSSSVSQDKLFVWRDRGCHRLLIAGSQLPWYSRVAAIEADVERGWGKE